MPINIVIEIDIQAAWVEFMVYSYDTTGWVVPWKQKEFECQERFPNKPLGNNVASTRLD
jgi:hypothetical protein